MSQIETTNVREVEAALDQMQEQRRESAKSGVNTDGDAKIPNEK
jgi:hypothetical protein